MNDYYVYKLIDPRTNNPFYVGKGKDDRMYAHLTEARGSRDKWTNKIKCQIINSIERSGREVGFEKVKESLLEPDAYALETDLIIHYGKIIDGTGRLSNIADGGEGGSGSNAKSIQSYSTTGALVNSYKSLTEAAKDVGVHKSSICAALNGRTIRVKNLMWAHFGESAPVFPKYANTTVVFQYDMEGTFLKEFETIKSASIFVNAVQSSIVGCCSGNGNNCTVGGYRWSYAYELPHKLPIGYKQRRKNRILQMLDQENVINEFNSIKEAVSTTAANPTGISDCCAGRKKTSGGYGWKWINPPSV